MIAEKADGALRDALSMFDRMISFSSNTLTYTQVVEVPTSSIIATISKRELAQL